MNINTHVIRSLFFALVIGFLANACSSDPTLGSLPTVAQESNSTAELVETVSPSPSPILQEDPLIVDDAGELLESLTSGEDGEVDGALKQIIAADDDRYVPVLIELMRAAQIGLVRNVTYNDLIDILEKLSGQELGDSWPAWVEWYGGTDLEPPNGFTSWKGRLLSKIDPQFAGFLKDDHPSRIRVEEIQ